MWSIKSKSSRDSIGVERSVLLWYCSSFRLAEIPIKTYTFLLTTIFLKLRLIYTPEKENTTPNIICFKEIIKEKCEIEKYTALKKDALRKFNKNGQHISKI